MGFIIPMTSFQENLKRRKDANKIQKPCKVQRASYSHPHLLPFFPQQESEKDNNNVKKHVKQGVVSIYLFFPTFLTFW